MNITRIDPEGNPCGRAHRENPDVRHWPCCRDPEATVTMDPTSNYKPTDKPVTCRYCSELESDND